MRRVLDGWRRPHPEQGSLSVVQMDHDAAPVSTAAVASSRPREDAEAAPWHGSRRGGATSILHQKTTLSKGPHINGMFAVIKR